MSRRGGTIYVDFSLFVVLYDRKFIKKIEVYVQKIKIKITAWAVQISLPGFHSEERLVNLATGRERSFGLSSIIFNSKMKYHNVLMSEK